MMDEQGAPTAPGVQQFLEQKNVFDESEDAYFKRVEAELEKVESHLKQQHDLRMAQIHATKELGKKMSTTARAWTAGLGEGATSVNCVDMLSQDALVRHLDGRLLSLALGGFAEIE